MVDSNTAPKWDWQRTLRMTAIGGLALGPTMAVWCVSIISPIRGCSAILNIQIQVSLSSKENPTRFTHP